MTISVIIPTLGTSPHLKKCLDTLYASFTDDVSIQEVLLVVNGSLNSQQNYVEYTSPKLTIYELKKNTGFTGACNTGASKALGTHLLFLNDDCFVESDTLQKMTSFLKENPNYKATQPIVYFPDGKTIENIGFTIDLTIGKARIMNLPEEWNSNVQNNSPKKIFGLSATCLLIEKETFMQVGMFDEAFHSYLEDVDLFLQLAGKKIRYFPTLSASCKHIHMGTSTNMGLYKELNDLKNWIRIIYKHFSFIEKIRYSPTLFIERLRNVSGLLKKVI